MKPINFISNIFLAIILLLGVISVTGCTPEPLTVTYSTSSMVTTTATETLPAVTITKTATETTTLTPQVTVPNQIAWDVTVAEAYAMVQENVDNPDYIILDVRTPEEHAEGYIEGSALVDMRSDTWLTTMSALDKDKIYLIY